MLGRILSLEFSWQRAIAELAVIALGVFVGLWADGWQTAREEAAEAREYSQRLVEDLRSDSVELLLSESSVRIWLDAAGMVRRSLSGAVVPEDSLTAAAELLRMSVYAPAIVATTFDELRYAGALRLLPPPVRRSAVRYYAVGAAEGWTPGDSNQAVTDLRAALYPVLDPSVRSTILSACCNLEDWPVQDGVAQRDVASRLRAVPDLDFLLDESWFWVQGRHRPLEEYQARAAILGEALRSHLR